MALSLFSPEKHGPLGQDRDRWLCLGSFVSKITNYKRQITNKSQIPIFNDQNISGRDIVWIFEFRLLEIVWYLQFGICSFNNSMNFQQSKNPLWG
jgi:hypothetical protein